MAFGGTDAEHLGCLLRLLYQHDLAIDIIATHVDLQPVLNIMTIWERCDLDSDPQTSVNHLGHLVLFMQSTIARYKVKHTFFLFRGARLYTQGARSCRLRLIIPKSDPRRAFTLLL